MIIESIAKVIGAAGVISMGNCALQDVDTIHIMHYIVYANKKL
jgi:hypothetical protein